MASYIRFARQDYVEGTRQGQVAGLAGDLARETGAGIAYLFTIVALALDALDHLELDRSRANVDLDVAADVPTALGVGVIGHIRGDAQGDTQIVRVVPERDSGATLVMMQVLILILSRHSR